MWLLLFKLITACTTLRAVHFLTTPSKTCKHGLMKLGLSWTSHGRQSSQCLDGILRRTKADPLLLWTDSYRWQLPWNARDTCDSTIWVFRQIDCIITFQRNGAPPNFVKLLIFWRMCFVTVLLLADFPPGGHPGLRIFLRLIFTCEVRWSMSSWKAKLHGRVEEPHYERSCLVESVRASECCLRRSLPSGIASWSKWW